MAYQNRTTFYRIPVMAYGDQMTEEQEMTQMSVIDSLLYAACFGSVKVILEEGTYSVQFSEDGTGAELVISPAVNGGYSLMGVVNGRMFCSRQVIRVGRLVPNMTYYVYAEYTSSIENGPGEPQIHFYTSQQAKSSHRLPLCVVTTTPGAPVVNTDVDKPHARNIIAHTTDTTNPHGETVSQKNLGISGSLTVGGNDVYGAIYASYTTSSEPYVWTPPAGQRAVFVHAYPESVSAGQMAWSINPSTGAVTVSNSGSSGVTVNLKIETEALQ